MPVGGDGDGKLLLSLPDHCDGRPTDRMVVPISKNSSTGTCHRLSIPSLLVSVQNQMMPPPVVNLQLSSDADVGARSQQRGDKGLSTPCLSLPLEKQTTTRLTVQGAGGWRSSSGFPTSLKSGLCKMGANTLLRGLEPGLSTNLTSRASRGACC